MFQTTRRRLALWYTMVTAVLLLMFASGFYGYVRLTLIDRIDDTITHVVEILGRSLAREPTLNLEANFIDSAADLEADHIDLEWFSPKGKLLWTTMPNLTFLSLDPKHKYRTVYPSPNEPLRQVTEAIWINHQLLGYLRVSHPWFEVTKPIQQLFLDLTIGITVTIIIVGLCGWWLSGLAMQPVHESYQRLKQFTADASHELRNPIAVIQTNAQVALADPHPNWQTQQHQFAVIERLTRRLSQLLEDLLFLARQDGGLITPVRELCCLNQILQQVGEEQQLVAQAKQITIEMPNLDQSVSILGDRHQLGRLFTNLVSNAITYTPAAGKVSLKLQVLGAQHQVQIQIQDTGVGIPETALPHIFDRFYRYQPQSPSGSGLGLAIASSVVSSHQGQIKVESQIGIGTIFTVTFPFAVLNR